MRALIKSHDAKRSVQVKALSTTTRGSKLAQNLASNTEQNPNPKDVKIENLTARVEELETALKEAKSDGLKAAKAAREEGTKTAKEAYVKDDTEALNTLKSALNSTCDKFDKRMEIVEKFPLIIATTALRTVFDKPEKYAAMVSQMINLQIREMQTSTIIGIRVSPVDFPDESALAQLESELAARQIAIDTDPFLGPGNCEIDLRLGHLEISAENYWDELSSLMEDMAQGKTANVEAQAVSSSDDHKQPPTSDNAKGA